MDTFKKGAGMENKSTIVRICFTHCMAYLHGSWVSAWSPKFALLEHIIINAKQWEESECNKCP